MGGREWGVRSIQCRHLTFLSILLGLDSELLVEAFLGLQAEGANHRFVTHLGEELFISSGSSL